MELVDFGQRDESNLFLRRIYTSIACRPAKSLEALMATGRVKRFSRLNVYSEHEILQSLPVYRSSEVRISHEDTLTHRQNQSCARPAGNRTRRPLGRIA